MLRLMPTIAVLVLIVPNLRADEEAEVLAALNQLNKAFETLDGRVIEKLMTTDHVAVTGYYGGPVTRTTQVKMLSQTKLSLYKTGKMKIKFVNKEVALIYYPLEMKGTFKGQPLSQKNVATAIWVKKDGKWLESFYQETALSAK